MKCETIRPMKIKNPQTGNYELQPPGQIIDHPQAFMQVRLGNAIPADEECRKKAGLSDSQINAARKASDRLHRGIHPEDFDIYAAGLMNGYDAMGNATFNGKLVRPSVIKDFRERQLTAEEQAEEQGIDPRTEV